VEFLALGGLGPGIPVRATVSDFGPQLLSKTLGANETQEQSLGLVFRYADTRLPRAPDHVSLPRKPAPSRGKAPKPAETPVEQLGDFLRSREGKALQRGLFGLLRKRL
jgi:hypothetical protein